MRSRWLWKWCKFNFLRHWSYIFTLRLFEYSKRCRFWHYIEIVLRKKSFLYTALDYYDVIKHCWQNNKFILHEMKRENFVSTKNLQNAIQKRVRKNTNGEKVNWLKICWMWFCKSAPNTILFRTSMEDTEFKTFDLYYIRKI